MSFGYKGCGNSTTACFKTTSEPPSPQHTHTHTHNFHANQTSWGLYEKLSGSKGWRSPHPTPRPSPKDHTLSHGFVTAGGSVFPTNNTFLHICVVPHFLPPATNLGKVIFSEACVKNSVLGGGTLQVSRPTPRGEVEGSGLGESPGPHPGVLQAHTRGVGFQAHTQGGLWAHTQGGIPACSEADPPADGYCCGRYASYWNALLL